MNIHVNGKQLKIGKSLMSYTEDHLVQISNKYIELAFTPDQARNHYLRLRTSTV